MKFLVLPLLLLSLGSLAQEEESEALRAMRLSCEKQKVALGCYNYANMLLRIDKNDDADKYFEIGCKLNHSPSCNKEKWDLPGASSAPTPLPESAPAEKSEVAPESTELDLESGETINE